jgi:aminopeptidase N
LFLFQLDNFFVAKISVLVKDSYELSHPISVEVINPNDIPSIFDSISYDKVIEQ